MKLLLLGICGISHDRYARIVMRKITNTESKELWQSVHHCKNIASRYCRYGPLDISGRDIFLLVFFCLFPLKKTLVCYGSKQYKNNNEEYQ